MKKKFNHLKYPLFPLLCLSTMLASCGMNSGEEFSSSTESSSPIPSSSSSISYEQRDLRGDIFAMLDRSKTQNTLDVSSFEGAVVAIGNDNQESTNHGFVIHGDKISLAKVALDFFLNGKSYSEQIDVSFFTNAGFEYLVTVRIVSKVISKPYELAEVFHEESDLDAYFVLDKDLDCEGMDPIRLFSSKLKRPVSSWEPLTYDTSIGFHGIFDGLGHTIWNLSTTNGYNVLGGLFGQGCEGSVIKNVAFSNFTSDKYSALFGESTGFSGTLENVVLTSSENCPTSEYKMFWRIHESATIRNVVVSGFSEMSYSAESATMENLYGVVKNENNKYNDYEYARFASETDLLSFLKENNPFADNPFIHFDASTDELLFGGNVVFPQ